MFAPAVSPSTLQILPASPNFMSSFCCCFKIPDWGQSVLPVYLWVWNHPTEHGHSTTGHTLKKTDSPSLRSHQLPGTFWLCAGTNETFLSPCYKVYWLDVVLIFYRQQQLWLVCECSTDIMSRRHCFFRFSPSPAFTIFLWLSSMVPQH